MHAAIRQGKAKAGMAEAHDVSKRRAVHVC